MSDRDSKPVTVGVSRGAAIVGMILTFVGGYFLGDRTSGRRAGPDLTEAIKAERKQVKMGLSPAKGPPDALVTIVEYADYQCRYCARSVSLQERMLSKYRGRLRWVFKNFPVNPRSRSRVAAQAALAAHQQGEFWGYHDLLFKNQGRFSPADFDAHAVALGLDKTRFKAALEGDALNKVVDADVAEGRALGVNGTPTFYINGRRHLGSISHRLLDRLIAEEMAYARSLVKGGLKKGEVYSHLTTPKQTPADEAKKDEAKKDEAS